MSHLLLVYGTNYSESLKSTALDEEYDFFFHLLVTSPPASFLVEIFSPIFLDLDRCFRFRDFVPDHRNFPECLLNLEYFPPEHSCHHPHFSSEVLVLLGLSFSSNRCTVLSKLKCRLLSLPLWLTALRL